MIEIRIAGRALELPPDIKISFELVNPLFSDVIGYNSHSFSFRVDDTPRNRITLSYADSVLTTQNIYSFDADVYLFGNRWHKAKLNVSSAANGYSMSLDIATSALARDLSEKSLREYELGGVRSISANVLHQGTLDMVAHANTVADGDVDSEDYTFFPVRNSRFYEGLPLLNPYPSEYQNMWRGGTFSDTETALGAGNGGYTWNLTPFPYLLYVLKEMITDAGYVLQDSDFLTDAEIKTLSIYNTQALDEDIYSFSDGIGTTETHNYRTSIDLKQHVPATNARDFLKGLADFFGLGVIIEGRNVQLIARKDILISKEQVNWVDKSLVGYTIAYEEWQGYTLFSELDEYDLLTEEPHLREDPFETIAGEVADITSLPISANLGDVYWVIDTNRLYQFDGNGAWADQGYYNFPIVVGLGEQEKTSIVSGPQVFFAEWHSGFNWRIPHIEALGNSDPYARKNFGFGNRIMFYRGKVTDDATPGAYPKGGVDDDAGTYNYSLLWHGDRGVYEVWHKAWIEMLGQAKRVTAPLQMDPLDIFKVEWDKRHRLAVKEGEVLGFLEKIKFTIGRSGIESAQALLVKG